MGERMSDLQQQQQQQVFLGVDVGTGSARAGIFDAEGFLLGSSSCPIQIWKDKDHVEQSSTDIWHAICAAVKAACRSAGVGGVEVKGIGFTATCSLVAIGPDDQPVTLSVTGDMRRNVMVWMDHRAVTQAKKINGTSSHLLQYVGGAFSPEMQPPKLLWVKENLSASWSLAFRWMDLGDWLTYRATGNDTRSLCTVVCKWGYLGHAHTAAAAAMAAPSFSAAGAAPMQASGWDPSFWTEIGLGELTDGEFAKIGRFVAFPGSSLKPGLSAETAQDLGLLPGTAVGSCLIDAHAGALGVIEGVPAELRAPEFPPDGKYGEQNEKEKDLLGIGNDLPGTGNESSPSPVANGEGAGEEGGQGEEPLGNRMVLVAGTSSCHLAVAAKKIFVPGVWGPYWSAIVPGLWLTEGGQSATGALLDHIINGHPAAALLTRRADAKCLSIFHLLNSCLDRMGARADVPFPSALTRDVHVLPDFHGNRSPVADLNSKGVLVGLDLDSSEENLAVLYLAAMQSLAYGTLDIVNECNRCGHSIMLLVASGGLSRNQRFMQEHADILQLPVVLPRESEPVLLGASMLAAVAGGGFVSVRAAAHGMSGPGEVLLPDSSPKVRSFHSAKFRVFKRLYNDLKSYQAAMADCFAAFPL